MKDFQFDLINSDFNRIAYINITKNIQSKINLV